MRKIHTRTFTGAHFRENREPGVIPGRTRHCEGELLLIPLHLLWGKGVKRYDPSQETCL